MSQDKLREILNKMYDRVYLGIANKISPVIVRKDIDQAISEIIKWKDKEIKPECEHDFKQEDIFHPQTGKNMTQKWRCRKCLEVKYTND